MIYVNVKITIMNICGLKLTHDASACLIADGRLIFSYEVEKIGNNPRHSDFAIGIDGLKSILEANNYDINQIDSFIFDGWHEGKYYFDHRDLRDITFAGYGSFINGEQLLEEKRFSFPQLGATCKSYKHIAGHAVGAYCSSPFSQRSEDSFILVWDGGMVPQIFYYHSKKNEVESLDNLSLITSQVYEDFSKQFDPFKAYSEVDLSLPGKVMAYCGLGKIDNSLLGMFNTGFSNLEKHLSNISVNDLTIRSILRINEDFIKRLAGEDLSNYSSPDILNTFQLAIGNFLIASLRNIVGKYPSYQRNLCYSGGAALNIFWNTSIRNSGIFNEIWIPPFTNDSGSSIGMACCEMLKYCENTKLDWNVYSGPQMSCGSEPQPFYKYPCTMKQLARVLHEFEQPILLLNGSAELGPRALGNRSIIAPANSLSTKYLLNSIKEREFYRPVAPICIEEDAMEIFDPGTPDPYMLFRHTVREYWQRVVPAICHVDNTARLQTINKNQNALIYELLLEYKALSGIPLLCNTSANLKGKGFFPDIGSALAWGKVNLIWSSGFLYSRNNYDKYLYNLR